MSGPYHEVDFPGFKQFKCDFCAVTFYTKQKMWEHQEKAHPTELKAWENEHK